MKGTVTVVLAVLLAMAIVFPGGGAVAFAADSFPDVPESHWASSYIDDVREAGIFQGFPDGSFRPENTVTYGEFLKMTTLSLRERDLSGFSSAGSHWASPYYEKGLSESWFSEREIPRAYLDLAIPREHMALILCGTLDSSGIFSFGGPLTGITDIHAGNPYAFEISVAYSEGLLNGYPDGSFRPKGSLTRAEAAAVLWRLLEKMKASETLAKVPADVPSVEQDAEGFTERDDSKGYFRQDFPEGDQYVRNDPADPAGTLRIVYDSQGADPAAQLTRIEKTLKEELGEDAWKTFLYWKTETLDAGKNGFRECAIGGRQIFLDTISGKIYIFLEVGA